MEFNTIAPVTLQYVNRDSAIPHIMRAKLFHRETFPVYGTGAIIDNIIYPYPLDIIDYVVYNIYGAIYLL